MGPIVHGAIGVLNFQVFYTMTAVEDLDEWQHKSVPVTESAELTNLEKFAQYAVAVAARTRSVSLLAAVNHTYILSNMLMGKK
jgi:hypothetical protein